MRNTPEYQEDQIPKLLLKADEVARKLSLGRATVYALMASGQLPTLRQGRAVRVPVAALYRWIESRSEGGVRA
jgi:excisionase family DNA binding protein